jgi:signal transduction histidine kinase
MSKRKHSTPATIGAARTLEAILAIATQVSAASDPLDILVRLARALIDGLDYTGGALFLDSPQSDNPQPSPADATPALPILPLTGTTRATPAIAQTMAGHVTSFAHGALDSRLPDMLRQLLAANHGEGGLLLPLQARGHMLGIMALYQRAPGAPRGSKLRLTASFAALVAMAFAQASSAHATRQHDISVTEEARVKSSLLAAAEQERHLRDAVLNATNEGMLLLDATGHVLLTNAAFHRLLDIASDRPPPDVIDFCAQLVPRLHDPEGFCQLIERAMAEEHSLTGAMVLTSPLRREFLIASTPVHVGHRAESGRLITLHDVTAARAAERVKSEFVALASHELRTPIHVMLNYLELLLDGHFGSLTPEQRRYLSLVMTNGEQLAFLTNDLLDLARLQEGQLSLHPTQVNLSTICHDVVQALAYQAAARQQQLQLNLPGAPIILTGDPHRLSQIVRNLVENALKYTPEGGTITVRARQRNGQAIIEVQDTGIGISPEEQARLFTRFFRADNELTRRTAGTGLGLAITRSLVELHGGTITVHSRPGSGSTFRVILPTTISTATAPSAATLA